MVRSPHSVTSPKLAWIAGLCLLLCALAPAAARAQSAGDEQYADPLAGQQQQPGSGSQGNGSGSQGNGSGSQGSSGSSGQGSTGQGSAATAPRSQGSAARPSGEAQSAADRSGQLPRTGLDVAPLALMGIAMLLSGLLLLWRLGPAPRGRRQDPIVLFDGTLPPLR